MSSLRVDVESVEVKRMKAYDTKVEDLKDMNTNIKS